MKLKSLLFVLLFLGLTISCVIANVNSTPTRPDVIKIFTNETMDPDHGQDNPVTGTTRYGQKSDPAAKYIVRWAVNAEGDHNFMSLGSEWAASGPYGMKLGMGDIPSNNCWLDIRRKDAAEGWDSPLDASGTGRVTFWIKAEPGTAPFWFHFESYKPSDLDPSNPLYDASLTTRQKSVNAFIDGETVIIKDDFGDLVLLRDNHFNGEWQFVSIPWEFFTMTDSAAVDAILPWSFPWDGSVKDPEPTSHFNPAILRTMKWHTKPESDGLMNAYWASEGNLWSDTPGDNSTVSPGVWYLDEVVFYPENTVEESPKYIDVFKDDMMEPDHGQDNPVTGTTRYGQKSDPASKFIVRWAVNAEGDHNFMSLGSEGAAEGPYGMKLGMGDIPSNNCWLDMRRKDAAEGWDSPLDASGTGRVTFWVKADSGTAPFWVHFESYKPSDLDPTHPLYDASLTTRQKSVNAFIDGGTVIIKDDFGDLVLKRDDHFNGQWQFVSIPWEFFTMTDSAAVDAILPWSFPWDGSVKDPEPTSHFNPSILRTMKWHTKPESDGLLNAYWASEGNLWSDTPGDNSTVSPGVWYLDEVRFQPLDYVEENPHEIAIFKNETMDPDHGQDNPVTGTTRYGQKSDPAAKYIVRWAVNAEGDHNFMRLGSEGAAEGPYGMKLGMGDIPSNNCWLDIRRKDAAEGWDSPLDASGTGQVSFWIKAEPGTAPFWFHFESYKPSDLDPSNPLYDASLTQRQKSVNAFIDGETVIIKDDFGDLVLLRDNHFNGEWQFVSIPWDFFTMTDSAAVDAILPWSFPWDGSVKDPEPTSHFNPAILRTMKWHTKPESDGLMNAYWASEGNLWSDTPGDNSTVSPGEWSLDEVVFTTNIHDGPQTPTAVNNDFRGVPQTYELRNAYPNPFNPSTRIEFNIPVSNNVKIEIFNVIGQKVRTLLDETRTPGNYTVIWDSRDDTGQRMSTGVYFVKMQSSHFNKTIKVMLLK